MRFTIPSREDAWDLTRGEKVCVMFLMNVVSALEDAKGELADRLTKIDGGTEMMRDLTENAHKLLDDVRRTIPERQRINLNNVAHDYELRLTPKLTPSKTSVVVSKDEFKNLVDAAQVRCRECVDDSEEAKKCELYKLLATVIPLDSWPEISLCPYNMAGWRD